MRCQPQPPREHDATLVARLRAAGAVFVCKTVLTEWGMSPIGNNVNFSHAAQRARRHQGARRLVDRLGRGRRARRRAARQRRRRRRLDPHPRGAQRRVRHQAHLRARQPRGRRLQGLGRARRPARLRRPPISRTFLDVVASAADPADELTAWAPPPPAGGFGALLGAGVRGLRIGVDDADWRDASEPVAQACREALRALEREGATSSTSACPSPTTRTASATSPSAPSRWSRTAASGSISASSSATTSASASPCSRA